MQQNEIYSGDRIEHEKYGLGFISSRSNYGNDAFFVAFDGRKDILWIESSEIKVV